MGHAGTHTGKTVLVVDDDRMLLMHTVTAIEDAGFAVLEAYNADDAIALLESRSDVGIVFTDIEMPGSMDGVKLAHAVRKRWPPVHLILASGRFAPDPGELPEGSRFFAKPYRTNELLDAIRDFDQAIRTV